MTTPAPLPDPITTPPIADTIRHFADRLVWSDLPAPTVQVMWHGCDDDTIRAIVAAFPDLNWRAVKGESTEWLAARTNGVEYTAFARQPVRDATSRLAALLNGDLDMAIARACADEAMTS